MKPKSGNANEKVKSFIDMTLKGEISWNSLESLLEDFTPDFVSSKQVIKILLKALKSSHVISKKNVQNEGIEGIVDAEEVPIQVSDSRNDFVESVSEIKTMKSEITVVIDDGVDLQIEEPQINSDAFQLEEAASLRNVESEENEVKPKILDAHQVEVKVGNEFSEDEDMPNENVCLEESVDMGLKKELLTYLSGSVDNNSENKWYTFVGENHVDQEICDVKVETIESIREEQKSFSKSFSRAFRLKVFQSC